MERGLYFTCWYRNAWNYHPSLPMRRLGHIEDIEALEGTALVWSCLGSGVIGLPYLYREAFEPIPPRLRLYGFMNDSEFCAECRKRGIKVFGVLWKAQMWEFPAEFSENGELLALNLLRGAGKRDWIGVHELSLNKYPHLFRPMSDFFPDGVCNSQGERVSDFLAECKTRSLEDKDILSKWLMVPGHEHRCYLPCFNNPVTLEYFKKDCELIVDAGASGVFLDEQETQLIAFSLAGGCFCKDCIVAFREYLRDHPDEDTRKLQLESFDYRSFLLKKGVNDQRLLAPKRWEIPLYKQFVRFNQEALEKSVTALSQHIKGYAARTGKDILVAGNFVSCMPHTGANRRYMDFISGEKIGLELRQDWWYRFAHAFCGGRPHAFVYEPGSSPHTREMIDDIDKGIHDKYMLFMLEGFANGVSVSGLYGSWMSPQNTNVKNAVYAHMPVAKQIGQWLKKHESSATGVWETPTAVLYDHVSAREHGMYEQEDLRVFHWTFQPFHEVTKVLCDDHRLFEVIYVTPDEPLSAKRLSKFRQLILPYAAHLSPDDAATVNRWQRKGGRCLVIGSTPHRIDADQIASAASSRLLRWVRATPQLLEAHAPKDVSVQLHRLKRGYALHVLNYRLDSATHRIKKNARMSFTLAWQPSRVETFSFPDEGAEATLEGNTLTLKRASIHTIVKLT